jgi:hypothetical protein
MNRKYKRDTLRRLKRGAIRDDYIASMRKVHSEHPMPRGHVLRQLWTHLHAGPINAKSST